MNDEENNTEDEVNDCQSPCDPQRACSYCADYWQRMRDEGFWIDGKGWTQKAVQNWIIGL